MPSIYLGPPLKPQPQHTEAELAMAVRIPPGVGAEAWTQTVREGHTDPYRNLMALRVSRDLEQRAERRRGSADGSAGFSRPSPEGQGIGPAKAGAPARRRGGSSPPVTKTAMLVDFLRASPEPLTQAQASSACGCDQCLPAYAVKRGKVERTEYLRQSPGDQRWCGLYFYWLPEGRPWPERIGSRIRVELVPMEAR